MLPISRKAVATGAAASVALLPALLAAPAQADPTFRTERFALAPVAGAPLRSGAVVDIHAQGPKIYAQERYQLVGAQPETTYWMWLVVHASAGCGDRLVQLNTDVLRTNRAGNATGRTTFTPEDAAPLAPGTFYIRWEVRTPGEEGAVVYSTDCVPVPLD